MAGKDEWWMDYFEDFRPMFDQFTPKQSRDEARYIMQKLQLKKGMKLLDCPCGIGRISLPLAKMGLKVTGVDITESYLAECEAKARKAGLKVELVKEDMRRISFKSRFHAAVNLFTSIGYFDSESDNLLVIKRVFDSLLPGGKFMLTTMNRDWIMVNFVPNNWFDVSGVRTLQSRSFDYTRSVMHDDWRFIRDGVEKFHQTTLRLYSFHELRAMCAKVGFVDIEGFGSHDDTPTGRTNRVIIVVATKPK
jgi:ubiquinone/menaquinone biosynthesis C-methylase UbiE